MGEKSEGNETIGWSHSGSSLFTSCPRGFFYWQQAIDGTDRNINNELEIESEYIGSKGALVGVAVHQSICQQINLWRKGGSPSMIDAQSTATDIIREYCDTYNFPSENYDRDPTADTSHEISQMQDSLSRTANSHLQTFFQVIWPQFTSHRYILHETTTSFTVRGHTVWVRPDLCTRDSSGKLVVTDWKTSPYDRQAQPHQLVCYALWAHRQYEPDLGRVRAQRVHTGTGEFDRVAVNQQQLDELVDQIISDCEEWNTRSGRFEFPTDPESSKCRKCSYIGKCNSGQHILEEEEIKIHR